MNRISILLIAIGSVFILTMAVFLGDPGTTGAAETCNIVTIRGRDNIEPNMLTVKKGDCVVWMNWTRDQDVLLSFKEGEKCIRATRASGWF